MRSARPTLWQGATDSGLELVDCEASDRELAGQILDRVQPGLVVRVRGLLAGSGPLEGYPALVQAAAADCSYEDLLADAVAARDEDEPPDGDALVDADDDADAVVGGGEVRTDGVAVAVGDWDACTDGEAVGVCDVNVLANDGVVAGEDTPWEAYGWAEAGEGVCTVDVAAAGADVRTVACP